MNISAEPKNGSDASTTSPTTVVVQECINVDSGEEDESLSPQLNVSSPKATRERRQPRVIWSEEAKLVLMQQVRSRALCLVAY